MVQTASNSTRVLSLLNLCPTPNEIESGRVTLPLAIVLGASAGVYLTSAFIVCFISVRYTRAAEVFGVKSYIKESNPPYATLDPSVSDSKFIGLSGFFFNTIFIKLISSPTAAENFGVILKAYVG